LVNVYSVRLVSGAVDASDTTFRLVRDFYAASPSILLFSLAALALVTAFVDKPAGANAPQVVEGEARPVSSRLAGHIRGVRSGVREVASAWRGDDEQAQLPALPSGAATGAAMARDERNVPELSAVERAAIKAALADYVERERAHKKKAENGTGYDTTGQLVLTPDEDAELRRAGGGNERGK
jgi:hypothetical protein